MAQKRLLITDPVHPALQLAAERLGYQVDYFPDFTREQTLEVLHQYTGLVVRTKFRADRELIDRGTSLRFIGRAGAGMDNIDVDYAHEKGITCFHASEGNRDAVAEHALGMLLSLLNNLRRADRQVRNGIWDREGNRGLELGGRTVALIGYGNTGSSFARKLSGFGVQVLAYDKYKTGFSDAYATEVSMEEVVKRADVLSIHLPLTRETRQLVNTEYLFHFRRPVFFLNTSRGEIVDTSAVLEAIRSGKVLGAGLDVLESEKFPALAQQPWYPELASSDQVILSPHVAGWTVESYRKISEVLAEKLAEWEMG